MRWRYVVLLLLLSSLSGSAAVWQPDSVAYNAQGGYYLLYGRDSVGAWQLRQLLRPSEYYQLRAEQLTANRFYQLGKPTKAVPLKPRPQLGLKANGYLTLNVNNTTIEEDNPLLPLGLRRRSHIEIRPEMNIHLQGSYGDRLKLDMSYDTSTALTNRQSRVRLRYEGEQFDFIQKLEAGNIRMDSRNPLIDTGQELFGLRGDFLLGAVSLQVVASRQHSEERKIVVQGGRQLRQTELRGSEYDVAQHFFLSEFFANRYSEALKDIPLVSSDVFVERVEVWITTPRQVQAMPNVEPVKAFMGASLTSDPPKSDMLVGEGITLSAAQRLPASAYTLHPTLGFISLHAPLGEGQVLAVAYSYRYRGARYQVGDITAAEGDRKVALLSEQDRSPQSKLWPLMMKNGYSLSGVRQDVRPEDLRIELVYKDPRSGIERPIIDRGSDAGRSWLELFGWDKTDTSGRSGSPDGLFDLVDGVTYQRSTGTLFLPFREPMVEVPKGDYPIFESLYRKSRREAAEERDKDLFRIRAEVSGVATQIIQLGHNGVEPGSVRVQAGTRQLTEGVDYRIDYTGGTLSLTTNSTERIEITIQERERVRRKEKSLVGAEINWSPINGLNVGGTLLSYREDSRRQRIRWGEEALRNRMWGIHASYIGESKRATAWLNQWSGLELREPMRLSAQASYAELSSNYNTPKGGSDKIVVEDFEQGNRFIDLTYPLAWQLGNLPKPEMRAQMAWFAVEPTLVRDGAERQPQHLRQDEAQRKHPLVREVKQEEFFPKRDASPMIMQSVPMLNLSFYPQERGPYNPEAVQLPSQMWGSMSFPLPTTDLQSQRYSYIEVWLLDPFTLDPDAPEGMLYLDLGRFADRILPDKGIYYEGAEDKIDTQWGRRAATLPQMYGFDSTGKLPIERQDIGLDGLSSVEERQHPRYSAFANQPDPARDDYHFYLGEDWDIQQEPILGRYKYINGLEGNSLPRVVQGAQSARTFLPDTEDLNRDLIEEEEQGYLRYLLPLTRSGLESKMIIGEKRLSERERWIKLRIPLAEPTEVFGSGLSLQDIRALRLSLTGFSRETQIRLAQFRLVSTAWAEYQSSIEPSDHRTATVSVGQLSLEEDGDRQPMPYLSPPQVIRERFDMKWAMQAEDEQALSMEVTHLEPGQPIALYKELALDLRHYRQLELWSHLESLQGVAPGELELFVRLGQDFTHNFYEYRLPLEPSPLIDYGSMDEEQVRGELWRNANRVDLQLELLPQLKQERDRTGADTNQPFTLPYSARPDATLAIQGFPTLGEISSVLIGIRNKGQRTVEATVWVNELSVSGARAMGGKAAQGSLQASVGELANLYLDGQYRSAGFGSITSDARHGQLEDHRSLALQTQLQLGLLFPKEWHLRAPLRYSYNTLRTTPYYDPFQNDLLNNGQGGSYQKRQLLELSELRVLPTQSKHNAWSLDNLLLRYRVEHHTGYAPDIQSLVKREAESELSYSYESSPQSYIRLNSLWHRIYHYQKYLSHDTPLSTLQSRWDWVRGLQIRQSYQGLTLSLQSTTQALIREPFEEQHRQTKATQFQWLTHEILRDIFALGETQSYRGQLELSYRLPAFEREWLKPLQGTATWRSNYQWQLGATYSDRKLGNRAENSSYLDLLLRYQPVAIHFRRTAGSSISGLLSGAGKAFGLALFEKRLVPGLPFMLAIDSPNGTFQKAQERGWLTQEAGSTQPLTTFWRNELDIVLTLHPVKGMELLLSYQNKHQRHTSLTPYQPELPPILRGSIRYSTIAFLRKDPLASIDKGKVPSLLNTLPNWQITYEIGHLSDWLQSHLSSLRLSHAYRSTLEVPTYYIEPSHVDLQSIVINEDLSPLIGLELRTKQGITLEERYNRRRMLTLLTTAQRMLYQTDQELFTRLSYRLTFAPIFQSKIALLRSSEQSLQLQLHHTYTHTLLHQNNTALQGLKGHTLQFSAEYGLSSAISVRAFFERQQRTPLVSNYTFPYRRTTYGVLLRLQLQP